MSDEKSCPTCYTILSADHRSETLTTICTNCGTRSVDIAILEQFFQAPRWQEILKRRRKLRKSRKKECGKGKCQLQAFSLSTDSQDIEIDICYACQQVWFDHRELEASKKAANSRFDQCLPVNIQEEIKKIQMVDGVAIPQHTVFDFSASDFKVHSWNTMPSLGWKMGLALFGLPIEHQNRLHKTPWMTYLLLLLVSLVSLVCFYGNQILFTSLGFLTSEPLRWAGLPILTSFFVHADYGHLLGNLYMLYLFGDNVEDQLGFRYFLLLLFGTSMGVLFHYLNTGEDHGLLVGASTGISAVIAYHALAFPRSQFSMLLAFVVWVRVPVFFYVLVWIGLQMVGSYLNTDQVVATSFSGHLGGVVAGICFWLFNLRKRPIS